MRFDALIFDFDGVLVESEYVGNKQIADYLSARGHPTSRSPAHDPEHPQPRRRSGPHPEERVPDPVVLGAVRDPDGRRPERVART